jgi:hypothetical protein
MDKLKRGAIMALLKACRELNEAYRTGVGIGAATHRHHQAVEGTLDLTIEHLDPPVPAYVSLHGKPLEDFLVIVTQMADDPLLAFAMDFMIDAEGLKIRVNGGPSWSPGFGEPRGSQ